jgi:type I restriction enzyme S subunit
VTQNLDTTQLPPGWLWTTLGEIGIVKAGGTPSTGNSENFGGEIAWITPADLTGYKKKFIRNGRKNLSEKGLKSSSAILLPRGTVLFSSRAPIGYVVIAENPVSTNQGFKNLIPFDFVFNEYVYYYLKGSKKLAESFGSGTTFKEVSASRFAKIPIPICPMPEQHRIVGKVEAQALPPSSFKIRL